MTTEKLPSFKGDLQNYDSFPEITPEEDLKNYRYVQRLQHYDCLSEATLKELLLHFPKLTKLPMGKKLENLQPGSRLL